MSRPTDPVVPPVAPAKLGDDVGGLHSRDTTHDGGTDDQGEEG